MNDSRGMTLVEILAGLVILSIVGLVALRYLGTGLTASGNSVAHVREQEQVATVMERITVEYSRLQKTDPGALAALKAAIGSESSDQDNEFGSYSVVRNRYIRFNASQVEIDDNVNLNVLKVKIKVGSRQMVSIFTM